jgi:hypothetical protein
MQGGYTFRECVRRDYLDDLGRWSRDGNVVGPGHDSTEEVAAARGHENRRSRRTATKRDGIVREMVHGLVKEFLRHGVLEASDEDWGHNW